MKRKKGRVMSKEKVCNKNCPHYYNGQCFKEAKDVKIVREKEPCKWEKKKESEVEERNQYRT